MANVKVYNKEGAAVGSIDLNDSIFGVEVNSHLMHLAVVSQLANKRQGTQSAKTRSEVAAAEENPGSRREQDMPVRVLPVHLSGPAAVLYLPRSPEITLYR